MQRSPCKEAATQLHLMSEASCSHPHSQALVTLSTDDSVKLCCALRVTSMKLGPLMG